MKISFFNSGIVSEWRLIGCHWKGCPTMLKTYARKYFKNCFGTRSFDAKKNIKMTKPPARIQKLHQFSPPPPSPHRERGGVSKMMWVPEGEIFSPTTSALRSEGKKLYSLLIFSIWNNLKRYTTGYRSNRYNRYRLLPNRHTIHQLTPHVLS